MWYIDINGILFTMRKKEILSVETTRVGIEGIMLKELNHTETDDTAWCHLYWSLEKKRKMLNSQRQRVEVWVPKAAKEQGGRERWLKSTDFQLQEEGMKS